MSSTNYLTLTAMDRTVLASYMVLVDGLAEYLGDGYEIVLHSLENLDQSAIKVINGHYTGRSEGAPITDLALEMLKKSRETNGLRSFTYFNKNHNGALLKSATIPVLGERGRIIGLLCINFHTETALSTILASLTPPAHGSPVTETFTDSSDDLISTALTETRGKVMLNPSVSASNKNKEIVRQLYAKGVFNLKDSVVRVAEMLDISKNTVYLHLRSVNQERQEK